MVAQVGGNGVKMKKQKKNEARATFGATMVSKTVRRPESPA